MTSLKVPPNNPELEQAVLGGLMLDSRFLDDVIEILSPQDFYRLEHQTVFQAMVDTCAGFDVVTICEGLNSSGKLGEAGGLDYIASLAGDSRGTANLMHYARLVKEKSLARQIIQTGYGISELGFSDEDDKLQQAQNMIMSLGEEKAPGLVHVNEVTAEVVKELDRRSEVGGGLVGLSSYFRDIDAKTAGLEPGALVVIAGRPSMGKELTLNSMVLLSSGAFKRMGDMIMGDKVASIDGRKSIVTGVFPQGVKPVFRVTFSDGRHLDTGLEHQFEVMCRYWDCPRVMTTAQLIEKLKVTRYQRRVFIPNHSGDFGEDNGIILNPYLLGVILGDGGLSSGSVCVTSSFEHIIEKIRPMLDGAELRLNQKITYRIVTDRGKHNPVMSALQVLGLMGKRSHEKFIPAQYMEATKKTRLELMCGLIDTDGTVEKTGAMTYTTTSRQMAVDVQRLARSLGAYASMSDRVSQYSYLGEKRNGKLAYTLCISCEHYGDFVTIPHKKSRVVEKQKTRRLNIESISAIDEEECQCISVSHPRALYMADDYTVTHNTTLGMNIAERAVLDNKTVLVFSLEMSRDSLMLRAYSSISDLHFAKLRKGAMNQEDWAPFTSALAKFKDRNFYIDDTPSLTTAQIRSRARRVQRKLSKPIDLIVVDYIQIMGDKVDGNDTSRITFISRNLKAIAKEFNCPVVALSQLNRGVEARQDKRPFMSDLRESGAIEQDADIIMLMYRDEYYHEHSQRKGIAECNIVKQRNGETGKVYLRSELEFMRFTDFNGQLPVYVKTKKESGFDFLDKRQEY